MGNQLRIQDFGPGGQILEIQAKAANISLEVDSVNIYYSIFNKTVIIYIGILQY